MTDNIEVLRGLLREAVPYLRDAGEPFEDDGGNEPLELSRRIEDALESDAALAAMGALQQPEGREGGKCENCGGDGFVVGYHDPYSRGDVSSPFDMPCPECAAPSQPNASEAQTGEIGPEWTPCRKRPVVVHVREQRPGEQHVSTREGITPIKPDDLIMRGVAGEEYPIGRDLFAQTYDLLATPPAKVPEGREAVDWKIRYTRPTLAPTPPAKVPEGDDVVGHKTFDNGHGGFRHEPLTRAEADVLLARLESEDERRKALMPDEKSALRMMMDAYTRLKDMGWNDAVYCPKDGRTFEVIEPGSTGIHSCIYTGEWPTGSWWVFGNGDMYPSRPVLFRTLAAAQQPKE